MDETTHIAIPLFPRFTALDGIGPYEVLQRIPGFDVTFIGHERGVVRSENGFLGIEVDKTFDEVPAPDVIVFPGGVGTRPLMQDERVLDWVRTAHETTTFTTSVCTGSLVLAAAGLLDGLSATTHWSAREVLTQHGSVISEERVVEHLDQRI
ncbi:MAG: DJ-1/PfpI family protein, partial [Ilumatobacteraceae bacterium]